MEAAWVSSGRWMGGKDAVCVGDTILWSQRGRQVPPFATTWMDFEGIVQIKWVSQRKTNTV